MPVKSRHSRRTLSRRITKAAAGGPVTHYVVYKIVKGKTSIALRFQGGNSTTVTGLSNDEARFMIDLLRNEKPINYLPAQKLLTFGAIEPVGEGE